MGLGDGPPSQERAQRLMLCKSLSDQLLLSKLQILLELSHPVLSPAQDLRLSDGSLSSGVFSFLPF